MSEYKGGVRNRRIRARIRLESFLAKANTEFDDLLKANPDRIFKTLSKDKQEQVARRLAYLGVEIDRMKTEIETLNSRI